MATTIVVIATMKLKGGFRVVRVDSAWMDHCQVKLRQYQFHFKKIKFRPKLAPSLALTSQKEYPSYCL